MKVLRGQTAQVAGLGPFGADAGQTVDPAVLARKEARPDAPQILRRVKASGAGKEEVGDAQAQVEGIEDAARLLAFLVHHLGAQFEQHLGNIDLDRAHLVAGAAQGGGKGKRLSVLHVHQLRCEDGADGAGVDRSVGVATGLAIDRAGVHAGRAANALQRLPLLGLGENRGAAIVQQHHVEFLRAVARHDPGPQRSVGIHALTGGRAGQQLQDHFQILEAGNHFLDAGQSDQGARQS